MNECAFVAVLTGFPGSGRTTLADGIRIDQHQRSERSAWTALAEEENFLTTRLGRSV
ncbi:hypothetical protein NGB36_10705 [Streptomyces sp. RB6PN25]|uniref:ATP-binding protein n=1 Tax=Streptomyces humicola TaxID=2953240 RepID=A0ABT1PTR1_9ACTN|nr:hypothetical protein [Streptomyces humicola]MCQ4081058.1 hypothetical protein [Streptomyces humicola]